MPKGIITRIIPISSQRLSAAEDYAFFDSFLQFTETVKAYIGQNSYAEKVKPGFA